MSERFIDRVVVVTGAAAGLGRALARGFAREGAHLVLLDIDETNLAETAEILKKDGATCSTHRVDLADEAAIKAFGARICAEHPQIHVLCNNAGIAYGEVTQNFDTTAQEKWLRYFAVNTIAPLTLAQALRPSLKAAQGAIVNQSSMAGYAPATPYGVTKAALNAVTYGMAHFFGADGVRVNAIAPGIMETPANRAQLTPETYARIQAMQVLQRHGDSDDIVHLAMFLASDEARFITCEVVSCDAGNRIRGWRY